MHKHKTAGWLATPRRVSRGPPPFGRFFMASMNRRDLIRSLTTAIAIPAISGLEPDSLFAVGRRAHRRARTGGLQVLDPHQSETVATIAEMIIPARSEEHTSELQSPCNLVCRLLLEKKKKHIDTS